MKVRARIEETGRRGIEAEVNRIRGEVLLSLPNPDWAGAEDPGGPAGQKVMYNFIEIEPYLMD